MEKYVGTKTTENRQIEGRRQGSFQRQTASAVTNLTAPIFLGAQAGSRIIEKLLSDSLAAPSPLVVGDGAARESERKKETGLFEEMLETKPG